MQLSPADLFDQLDAAPDAALIDRFLADRDELAFARLVQRHGSMVLGVCRRVLGDAHAAEDAFQATFLVLVRRAADADGRQLGPWLYGIAYRTALKARVAALRRAAREQKAGERARPRPSDPPPADVAELGAVLDEELNRLPGQLREAVVLCDLEGLSRRQAARRAGCPESTLSSRLVLARERLARQLTRRGVAPVFAGLAAAVPAALSRAACSAAVAVAAGVAADVPAPVSRLSDEVIRTMTRPRKIAAAGVVAVAALALAGAVVVADGPGPAAGAGPAAAAVAPEKDVPPEKDPPPASPDRLRFVAFDGFDGRLGLNWKPVRPDPSHVSLKKHPGRLTITTQKGTIHERTERDDRALAARNVYLVDNPLVPGGDFVATTCLVGFRPTAAFQQAGLILYDDDDNYLKWVDQFNWEKGAGECFALVAETGGKRPPAYDHTDADPRPEKVWLRLTKRGNTYDCATSADGARFVTHTTAEWGKGGPKKIGLIAKNGGRDVPEIDARFEFFELRAP